MIKKKQNFFYATKILLTLFLCSYATGSKLYTMSSDNLYDALIFNKNSNILDICKTIISSYEFQEPCIPNDTFYTPEDFCDDFLNPIPLFPIKFVSELATEVNSLLQKKITQHTTKTSLTDLNDNNYGIYAQAMIVEQDAHVITIGDLHGNVHSLARIIKNLHQKNLISPEGRLAHSTYIVFTGDLADRGHFGVETWIIALLLKIQNPDNVIILQGNHEHKELTQLYGFHAEILAKYQKEEPAHAQYIAENLFPNLFKLLPQTCFIGAQSAIDNSIVFTQYMHAGLPMFKQSNNEFFNIEFNQLLDNSTHSSLADTLYVYHNAPKINGLIWNSFFATQDNPETLYKTGIRCGGMDCSVHGLATLKYLNLHQKNNYSVCGIIRGHDHKETISQLCYTNINLETCLFPEYTDNSWKTILDTTPLIFDPNTQAFPVFTITSVTDIFGVDNFAILSFNKDINTWMISPITKKQRAIYKTHSTPNHINTLTENTINIQRTIPKAFMSQRSHNKITIIRPKLLQPTNTGKPKNIPVQHIIFKQK